ncbi:hypothetical protein OIU78_022974 [Salix suchowensis]|nr:hypothetical protein OIU78_022974 [Salix suchowensis]
MTIHCESREIPLCLSSLKISASRLSASDLPLVSLPQISISICLSPPSPSPSPSPPSPLCSGVSEILAVSAKRATSGGSREDPSTVAFCCESSY